VVYIYGESKELVPSPQRGGGVVHTDGESKKRVPSLQRGGGLGRGGSPLADCTQHNPTGNSPTRDRASALRHDSLAKPFLLTLPSPARGEGKKGHPAVRRPATGCEPAWVQVPYPQRGGGVVHTDGESKEPAPSPQRGGNVVYICGESKERVPSPQRGGGLGRGGIPLADRTQYNPTSDSPTRYRPYPACGFSPAYRRRGRVDTPLGGRGGQPAAARPLRPGPQIREENPRLYPILGAAVSDWRT